MAAMPHVIPTCVLHFSYGDKRLTGNHLPLCTKKNTHPHTTLTMAFTWRQVLPMQIVFQHHNGKKRQTQQKKTPHPWVEIRIQTHDLGFESQYQQINSRWFSGWLGHMRHAQIFYFIRQIRQLAQGRSTEANGNQAARVVYMPEKQRTEKINGTDLIDRSDQIFVGCSVATLRWMKGPAANLGSNSNMEGVSEGHDAKCQKGHRQQAKGMGCHRGYWSTCPRQCGGCSTSGAEIIPQRRLNNGITLLEDVWKMYVVFTNLILDTVAPWHQS